MDRNLAAEINALQEYGLVVSSDSDAEDLLCERYLEKEETLYLAAFHRAIRPPFNQDNITAPKATQLFRLTKDDLGTLCRLLRLPPVMTGRNRTSWSGMEVLCLVLCRLSYPCKLVDMEEVFGYGTSEASVIINDTIDFLYSEWGRLLTDLDQHTEYLLTPEKVQELCTSIHSAGCPLENGMGLHRWNLSSDLSAEAPPTALVQWAQTTPCHEISIPHGSVRHCCTW